MKKQKIAYFIITLLLISVTVYIDHHNLNTGNKFHRLAAFERNAIRITKISTIIATPTALFGIMFLPGKPVGYKTSTLVMIYLLSIYPSYRLYRSYFI